MKDTHYSIRDLEVISGIKAHTIRIWEKRYKLLSPDRTDTNIRYYNDDDLRRILNVSLLVRNGFKISRVAEWDDNKIRDSVVMVSGQKTSDNDYVERLMFCVVNMDISGFKKLAGDIIENMGIEEAVPKIFFRLFVRIGTYWQVGSVFPAQEHIITHIYRQKLIASIDTLNVPEKKGKTILFFLAEEEMHELSLLYYSYLGGKLGYEVVYLGQSVPFEDLKRIRTQMSIDYVFTAFIKPMEKGVLETYLEDLKQVFDSQKIFITGGQIEFHNPHLPRGVKIVKDNREFRKYLH